MKKTYKRKRKRKVYKKTYGKGIKVARPYINKRNRLMLGEGKKKTVKKQRGGFLAPIAAALAPTAIELVSKLFR